MQKIFYFMPTPEENTWLGASPDMPETENIPQKEDTTTLLLPGMEEVAGSVDSILTETPEQPRDLSPFSAEEIGDFTASEQAEAAFILTHGIPAVQPFLIQYPAMRMQVLSDLVHMAKAVSWKKEDLLPNTIGSILPLLEGHPERWADIVQIVEKNPERATEIIHTGLSNFISFIKADSKRWEEMRDLILHAGQENAAPLLRQGMASLFPLLEAHPHLWLHIGNTLLRVMQYLNNEEAFRDFVRRIRGIKDPETVFHLMQHALGEE